MSIRNPAEKKTADVAKQQLYFFEFTAQRSRACDDILTTNFFINKVEFATVTEIQRSYIWGKFSLEI